MAASGSSILLGETAAQVDWKAFGVVDRNRVSSGAWIRSVTLPFAQPCDLEQSRRNGSLPHRIQTSLSQTAGHSHSWVLKSI